MEIDRGVQNIRRENEQEGDFSSKLYDKEKTVAAWIRLRKNPAHPFQQQHTRRYVSYCTSVLSIDHLSTIYRPSVDQNVDKYRPTIDGRYL